MLLNTKSWTSIKRFGIKIQKYSKSKINNNLSEQNNSLALFFTVTFSVKSSRRSFCFVFEHLISKKSTKIRTNLVTLPDKTILNIPSIAIQKRYDSWYKITRHAIVLKETIFGYTFWWLVWSSLHPFLCVQCSACVHDVLRDVWYVERGFLCIWGKFKDGEM